jgi:hypothetical protein
MRNVPILKKLHYIRKQGLFWSTNIRVFGLKVFKVNLSIFLSGYIVHNIFILKEQCLEIFDPRFFSLINPP